MPEIVACCNCFRDHGLHLDARRFAFYDDSNCPNCGSAAAPKLDAIRLAHLADSFFVRGSLQRFNFGGAPAVIFNKGQTTQIGTPPWLEADLRLFESKLGVGFFPYGPRSWMFGEIGPLKALQADGSRAEVVGRILKEYPGASLKPSQTFYRVRVNPNHPATPADYDSPPVGVVGSGRLSSAALPVMYGSFDLQVCMHECRTTAADELFVATLEPTRSLALLDLTEILREDGVTEFESLDLAVHMLFLAGPHSYELTREIAIAARAYGFDGLLYPSYFSLLRTGAMPFETTYGISHRRLEQLSVHEKSKIVPNIALFGRPIEEGNVKVVCLNKIVLRQVEYDISFGPVGHGA